jgi:DNA-binding NarL/FixJ family response regulator
MAIKLLVVDDHEIIRHGLASLFRGSEVRVCGEAASGDEAVRGARRLEPQVVLLNVILVAMGLSNQEIADSLEISVETVKEHMQNLLRKISVSDRTQAAVWVLRHGLA